LSDPIRPTDRQVLDKTILLLRDDVRDETPDDELLQALMGTTLVISVDEETLLCPRVQLCVLTTAMLALRSGARVQVAASDCALAAGVAAVPLFRGTTLAEALADLGECIIPGGRVALWEPQGGADLVVVLGDGPDAFSGVRILRGWADGWEARLEEAVDRVSRALGNDCNPFGWLALAALIAAELHKAVLLRLLPHARNETALRGRAEPGVDQGVILAPASIRLSVDLGEFDLVSGGAITGAVLYCLAAIPGAKGAGRVIEPETFDGTNLNRYAALRSEMVDRPKAAELARQFTRLLGRGFLPQRFGEASAIDLAPRVMVGVDHIPSRWAVQAANPKWLGIGATSHYELQVTEHPIGAPCARCLHPHDGDGNVVLPTIAFTSFWAGLLLAVRFVRVIAGAPAPLADQSFYASGLRVGGHVMVNPGVRRAGCNCTLGLAAADDEQLLTGEPFSAHRRQRLSPERTET
jgi:hypothetical protein